MTASAKSTSCTCRWAARARFSHQKTYGTIVLIGSSLTMALAVRSAQTGAPRATVGWLLFTIALGLTFLVVKFFEYKEKFELHHVPGPSHSISR